MAGDDPCCGGQQQESCVPRTTCSPGSWTPYSCSLPPDALLSLGDNTDHMRGKDPCSRSQGVNLEIPVLASLAHRSVLSTLHLGREGCVSRILIATAKSWKTKPLDHGLSIFIVRGPCSLHSAFSYLFDSIVLFLLCCHYLHT